MLYFQLVLILPNKNPKRTATVLIENLIRKMMFEFFNSVYPYLKVSKYPNISPPPSSAYDEQIHCMRLRFGDFHHMVMTDFVVVVVG
jgi:hypothetical protein